MDHTNTGTPSFICPKPYIKTCLQTLGYQRTLQASDLWKVDAERMSGPLSAKFEEAWSRRLEEAAKYNEGLRNGTVNPNFLRRVFWFVRSLTSKQKFSELEDNWRSKDGQKRASLALALNDSLGRFFWIGGVAKVFADTAQLMCPLLVKVRCRISSAVRAKLTHSS